MKMTACFSSKRKRWLTVISLLTVLMLSLGIHPQASANLITNGDFESGNTGFSSDYTFSSGDLYLDGYYRILSDPSSAHGSAASYEDHTSGFGLMMAVNASTDADRVIWSQEVDVLAGVDYTFSAWISSWTSTSSAQLQFSINSDVIGIFLAPSTPAEWSEFRATWDSMSSTSATIQIIELTQAYYGNDFALDDISMEAVPIPVTILLFGSGLFGLTALRQKFKK